MVKRENKNYKNSNRETKIKSKTKYKSCNGKRLEIKSRKIDR